jgi:polyferredoxin
MDHAKNTSGITLMAFQVDVFTVEERRGCRHLCGLPAGIGGGGDRKWKDIKFILLWNCFYRLTQRNSDIKEAMQVLIGNSYEVKCATEVEYLPAGQVIRDSDVCLLLPSVVYLLDTRLCTPGVHLLSDFLNGERG